MTDITELAQRMKAAAEKATPGGWCIDDYHGVIADAGLNGNYYIASCSGPDHRSNKRFIALANPANVLALVEALEKAQRVNNSAPTILRQLAEEKQKRGEVAAATAFNYAASALQKELSK
ncbi:ead/Ea22-like family protein [Raoultella ornithinolytica]|uniref:ead/Ea22-like family protein n=1 Tax=Raoultella ornithinolytica TaxID=54291 RepID=UPI0028DF80E3|nr:ead/Ea22-like family protein [Raoultella ornithinolytica]ELM7284713.1 ead/Ea22-like family protein [Raoultella ornithinolytica]ELO0970691.1 ead/Ea22-like family protein [Raoultella ornithinolytica]